MVVCKFFLQGTCKFGSYCHYDHQLPNNYNYTNFNDNNAQSSTSVLRQSAFNNPTSVPNKQPSATSVDALVKSVAADMLGAERGGQWLLSCYAPFKEKSAFPGFEDQSPEEIRLGFYEAQKNSTLDQYKQQLQVLLQSTLVKVRALQNPSPEIVAILQGIYNAPPSGSGGQQYGAQSTSMFGKSNNSFNNSNIFASSPSQGVLSAPQPPQAQTNIFGAPNTSNQTKSIFGGSETKQQPTNIFSNNIFGSPSSSTPVFGSPTPPSNVFAAQTPNVFATPPQQQQQNIFASANQNSNIFGQQANLFAASNSPLQQQAIFGGPNTPMGTAASSDQVPEGLYSKLEDLNAEEIEWFQSDSLDINGIPEKPPTYDMCFK